MQPRDLSMEQIYNFSKFLGKWNVRENSLKSTKGQEERHSSCMP
jgi:hypothetical protein